MGRPSALMEALWAVLFTAVCAWALAGLYREKEKPDTAVLRTTSVLDSAELDGIAVRSEQTLRLENTMTPTVENGRRVGCGGELARSEDGSVMLCQGSAVYFDSCDGYEYLCPEALEALSVSGLSELLSARSQAKGEGRLVADYVWYFAALTDYSPRLPDSGGCRVLFDGFDTPIWATVLSLSAPEKGKTALVLRLTQGGDYLSLRRTGAKLIFSEYSGLSVPAEAIRSDGDGNKLVYTLSTGAFYAERVDILYSGGDFALIAPQSEDGGLREGSRVLLAGDAENGYS